MVSKVMETTLHNSVTGVRSATPRRPRIAASKCLVVNAGGPQPTASKHLVINAWRPCLTPQLWMSFQCVSVDQETSNKIIVKRSGTEAAWMTSIPRGPRVMKPDRRRGSGVGQKNRNKKQVVQCYAVGKLVYSCVQTAQIDWARFTNQ